MWCHISSLSISIPIFPGEYGLVGFIEAKDDGSGGDKWSYKSCKAAVKSSPPTNQHPTFYKLDAQPVAQPTVSKHWREMKGKCDVISTRIISLSAFV